MAEPLAALTDLATLTGLPETDQRLALALQRASNRFYGDTNRQTVLAAPHQDRHNGNGGPTILLRGAPVVSVESVTIDGTALTAEEYSVDEAAGVLRLHAHRADTSKLGGVVVDYTAGYQEIPGDIADAVLEHATTIAMVLVHLQQESGGNTQATYGKEATVGTTAKWTAAVEKYNLGRIA